MKFQTLPLPAESYNMRDQYAWPVLEQRDVSGTGNAYDPHSFLGTQKCRPPVSFDELTTANSKIIPILNNVHSKVIARSRDPRYAAAATSSLSSSSKSDQRYSAVASADRLYAIVHRPQFHVSTCNVHCGESMHGESSGASSMRTVKKPSCRASQKFQNNVRGGDEADCDEKDGMANSHSPGPASRTWELHPRGARRQLLTSTQLQRKRYYSGQLVQRDQQNVGERDYSGTVQPARCMRCQIHKIKCEPNPYNLHGICQSCLKVVNPILPNIPCIRHRICDASLFREQERPWPGWTSRWSTMEIRDIRDWSSMETIRVNISNCIKNVSYELELRPFKPLLGDQTFQIWKNRWGHPTFHSIPSYAILDMKAAARSIRLHVDGSIAFYLDKFLNDSDYVFWNTFVAAFKWSKKAPTPIECQLVVNCLCLWVVCRMASHPESISGTDKIGPIVVDTCSPYYGMRPLPPVMNAQLEIIMYSTLLRPLRTRILDQLESLMKHKVQSNWVTVYFALFILLHNCSMTTRRDAEFAHRSGLATTFANTTSIIDHHKGVLVMLLHFHLDGRGRYLTSLMNGSTTMEDFARSQGLPAGLSEIVRESAVNMEQKRHHIQYIRANAIFGDDYYFVSQLFDQAWRPSRIATPEAAPNRTG